MSRRTTPLFFGHRDGTSQRSRRLAALDPAYAPVDERTSTDLLSFVQAYAKRLRYFGVNPETGTLEPRGVWDAFAERSDLSAEDVAVYLADPARFDTERTSWLGRPHFVLLLAFLELLGMAREQLNGFGRRHLDYYYRELLGLKPLSPVPDRAMVLVQLAPNVAEARLAAGSELSAGRDGRGVPRVYRTERELIVNRASIVAQRSLHVDRRITGIPDVRADRELSAPNAFDRMLSIALGSPSPGDAVFWDGLAVDHDLFANQLTALEFTRSGLFLEQDELRSLMRLYRRRRDADAEWARLNALLGVANPAHPRDFEENLRSRVGALDFHADGLAQVNSVDDLYTYHMEDAIRDYIASRLAPIGYENFVLLMQIKFRIDGEWAQINRLLERIGRRQRGLLAWSLPAASRAEDFGANLAAALGDKWPPDWRPAPSADGIDVHDATLRRLELRFGMPVERIEILVAFARRVQSDPVSSHHDWSEVDRILADAHREKVYGARRAELAAKRGGRDDAIGFDRVVSFVLNDSQGSTWSQSKPALSAYLEPVKVDLLDRFRTALETLAPIPGFGWAEADALLELGWRRVQMLPEPVAQRVAVHGIYAHADATEVRGRTSMAWKTFGGPPLDVNEQRPAGAVLGFALRSPVLSLSEGARTLTLTVGLRTDGFDLAKFLAALDEFAAAAQRDPLVQRLDRALKVEVTTAKGWIPLGLSAAELVSGAQDGDYWSLQGLPPRPDHALPALQLRLDIDASVDAIAALKGDTALWPTLRVTLQPRWDPVTKGWRMPIDVFEPLVLSAVNLKAEVRGLSALTLQQEDRALDPRKPFEPFGKRPAVGARLYLYHAELLRPRLTRLQFDIEWMGLPSELGSYYANYPNPSGAAALNSADFKAGVTLVDRNLELKLGDVSLFESKTGQTNPNRALVFADPVASMSVANPAFAYTTRNDLSSVVNDVRLSDRFLCWELAPVDFGHPSYASLSANKARALALAIANKTISDGNVDSFRVEPPYTPTIKRLGASYATSVEFDLDARGDDAVLHLHPFGACAIDPALPTFMPRYAMAGELYLGIRDLHPPQHLSLLLQLAEGTSDSDAAPAPVSWSYLDRDGFRDLGGAIIHDSTNGLINSGIVELALPAAAPNGQLPTDLYWIRVATPRTPNAVCDVVAIRTQAVAVRFDDRDNDPRHYQQPLAAGSIDRLVSADARFAGIEQPYTSFGGSPGEQLESFDTRVSERLRHKQRALCAWDYERLVLQRFPQIYKTKCLSTPRGVDVIVIPDVRALLPSDTLAPKAPANLLGEIQTFLSKRAPETARVRVRNAQYVLVQIKLGVRFHPGLDQDYARRRLSEDLSRYLSPWAFNDGADLMIGSRIYANSIVDFVDRRDYVDYVADIKLYRNVDGEGFELIPPSAAYHVATTAPDQVLVAAQQHYFDVIPDSGYKQAGFTGIDYARIELDFTVA